MTSLTKSLQPFRRVERAPWHFRLAQYLIDHDYRGGYRLIATARKLGWLNVLVPYAIGSGVTLDVPLYREENLWSRQEVLEYEAPVISLLADTARQRPEPVTFIDCGADIGLFSLLMEARCGNLARVVAFEPNSEAFPVLKANVERLPLQAECHPEAVSDFAGRAELRSAGAGTTGHASFIVPAPAGDIQVMRVDDLDVDPSHGVILKIDVEGAELNVLRGAVRTLSAASWFLVVFEAHPKVFRRTGIDPTECMRLLHSIRECTFQVAEAPEVRLVEDRPFFEQVPEKIYNVVCACSSLTPEA